MAHWIHNEITHHAGASILLSQPTMLRHVLFYLNADRQAFDGYDTKDMCVMLGPGGTLNRMHARNNRPRHYFTPDEVKKLLSDAANASTFLEEFITVYSSKKLDKETLRKHPFVLEQACATCDPFEGESGDDRHHSDDEFEVTHPGIWFSDTARKSMYRGQNQKCWYGRAREASAAFLRGASDSLTENGIFLVSTLDIIDHALSRALALAPSSAEIDRRLEVVQKELDLDPRTAQALRSSEQSWSAVISDWAVFSRAAITSSTLVPPSSQAKPAKSSKERLLAMTGQTSFGEVRPQQFQRREPVAKTLPAMPDQTVLNRQRVFVPPHMRNAGRAVVVPAVPLVAPRPLPPPAAVPSAQIATPPLGPAILPPTSHDDRLSYLEQVCF